MRKGDRSMKTEFSVVGTLVRDNSGDFYCLQNDGTITPLSDQPTTEMSITPQDNSTPRILSSSAEDIDVGAMFKQARIEKRLGLRETARQVGKSSNHVSRLENGDNSPTLKTLREFSEALGHRAQIILTPIR